MNTQEEIGRINELFNFNQVQKRDGLPCPDTGLTHCRSCHGVDETSCGHWVGCPEC